MTSLMARPAPHVDRSFTVAEWSRPSVEVLRWSWRLMRRGVIAIWLTVAAYMALEVFSFQAAYPTVESRQKLLQLAESSAARMLQGKPGHIESPGGFGVWDAGWMVMLIVGTWAVLSTTRLTRGEEDSGRAELVLSRPVQTPAMLIGLFGSMTVALVGIVLAAAVPLIVLGEAVAGSVLWGLGLAAFAAVCSAVAAVGAQIVEPRRRAASFGLALLAAGFLTRVVANSADSRDWVLSLTPFGWVDRLRVFGENRWLWLVVPVVVATAFAACAVALSERRDTGAALLSSSKSRRSRLHLLGGAASFGWRLTSGALIAWSVGVGVTSLVFGLMIGAIADFIKEDESYRKVLESMGMDMSAPIIGFLSYMAVALALAFAMFLGWRLGALRQEEADGRLDNLLTRGVVRWRLLTASTALAFAADVVLVVVSGAGLWAGAQLVHVEVSVADVAKPLAGTLPLVILFTGIAVLTFALAPRLTVIIPVTLSVAAYLLDTFGQMLDWPHAIIALSPYHHLMRLPGTPMTTLSVVVMIGLGLAAALVGVVVFSRRDVAGA